MNKTFRINEKKLDSIFKRRLFLANLPSLSLVTALLVIVLISVSSEVGIPSIIYKSIFFGTYFCTAYSFIVCVIGGILSDVSISSHKKHTSIEISDSLLIISELNRTVRCDGKLRHYKKLWIINLNDVESTEYYRNCIIINGKARYFCQDADWLGFERTENGIDFDNWWYNSNGGKIVQSVEIHDYYTDGERIAQRIIYCRDKIAERTRKREEYRRRMLEIAKNTKHKRGISEKYIPPYKQRKTFR